MKSERVIKKFYEMIIHAISWKFMAVGAYIIKCERLKWLLCSLKKLENDMWL